MDDPEVAPPAFAPPVVLLPLELEPTPRFALLFCVEFWPGVGLAPCVDDPLVPADAPAPEIEFAPIAGSRDDAPTASDVFMAEPVEALSAPDHQSRVERSRADARE